MDNLLAYPQIPLKFTTSIATTSGYHRNTVVVRASAVSQKTKRKKQQKKSQKEDESLSTSAQMGFRLVFMEDLMERARSRDTAGVSEVMYDMIAAGISPGPRSFHGLIISHVLNGDHEGAMHALRRELSEGLCPVHETFVALIRLFGSKGFATRGLEILAAMEKLKYDIRIAWLVLVEELIKSNHLEDANKVFFKGAEGGLRATDEIYDLLIEEDCKVGDHANALTIAYKMEAGGRIATTKHFNWLLSCQATCGIPEVAFATFENMEYGGEDCMKPDTETYNWLMQAYTRADSYDRLKDVGELLGMMVDSHKRGVQPNMRTYAILVECFTKYCALDQAVRHFRGLKNFDGGTTFLHYEGNYGDPLSLYLRALCREGMIVEMLEALETMAKDKQPIPPRALYRTKNYRTLVSSWIEPLQEEADVGYEIDYIARYIEEGGLTGERKRWVPRPGKTPLDPDADGYVYNPPHETSFKKKSRSYQSKYYKKIHKALWFIGPSVLGDDVPESDCRRVWEWLDEFITKPLKAETKRRSPSSMLVNELREELEAQGLPTDGTRAMLYQRVQKARRINISRGVPLWTPPVQDQEVEVDPRVEELISRVNLEEGNTELWRHNLQAVFDGANIESYHGLPESKTPDVTEDLVEEEDGDSDGDEEKMSQKLSADFFQDVYGPPPRLRRLQLKRLKKLGSIEYDLEPAHAGIVSDEEMLFSESIHDALREMYRLTRYKVSDMYTIADAWGWTWERELKKIPPRRWSQEWEVELAIKIMLKVIELGSRPTIEDCAMVLRAAIRAPLPSAFLQILQISHSLGYVFGSRLYEEIVTLCVDINELDAAVAIVADMETSGITVPVQVLDKVISARQTIDTNVDDSSS